MATRLPTRSPVLALVPPTPAQLAEALAIVSARTGADLRGQRPVMLARRVLSAMAACGIASADAYLARLRDDETAAWRLLERLTIKVSRFFRNPEVHAALRGRVLPELRRARGAAPLRAWSAGCARGQEAHGLAMLLDAVGGPWTVLATDVDPAALAAARAAAYAPSDVLDVPPELAARSLAPLPDGRVAVVPRVASRVRLAPHDLGSGRPPPGGPFDLVLCRNVLIYFMAPAQREIVARLVAALAPGGILCLGEAEWPVEPQDLDLEVVDRTLRIFRVPVEAERQGGAAA